MKITNFVKSPKRHFWPLTPKCTRVLRTTAWQAKPKQHKSTHGTHGLVPYWKRWAIISSRCWATVRTCRSLRIWCSYWWDVTFTVIEWPLRIRSSGTDVLRQANCHFCLSTKCVQIVIFLSYAIPHHLKPFWCEPLWFWYPEFIETTQGLHLTCITHQLDHFPMIDVQTEKFSVMSQVCDSS